MKYYIIVIISILSVACTNTRKNKYYIEDVEISLFSTDSSVYRDNCFILKNDLNHQKIVLGVRLIPIYISDGTKFHRMSYVPEGVDGPIDLIKKIDLKLNTNEDYWFDVSNFIKVDSSLVKVKYEKSKFYNFSPAIEVKCDDTLTYNTSACYCSTYTSFLDLSNLIESYNNRDQKLVQFYNITQPFFFVFDSTGTALLRQSNFFSVYLETSNGVKLKKTIDLNYASH